MDVSSATSSTMQVEAMKKAQDVQAQQVLKTIEAASEQSKQITAQKTGMGNNINLTA